MKKLVNIHKHAFLLLLFVAQSMGVFGQEIQKVTSFAEIMAMAKAKNVLFRNAQLQSNLAELTRKTAVGNVVNPRIPSSVQLINNLNQQVSFLPAEAFGGAAGTFREVVIGQQYVSTFNFQPQFDLFNLAAVAQIQTAKINQNLVENQHKLNEQKLYEQLNSIYFSILLLEAQKEILTENIQISEQIVGIVRRKFEEGIGRKQDLNEAEANLISLKDKLQQATLATEIQYESLDLFVENNKNTRLEQHIWAFEDEGKMQIEAASNTLAVENSMLQLKAAENDLKVAKYQQLPTLSFISALNWQNLSNQNLFHQNSNWINFSFVGLKLNWDLPTTVQKFASTKTKEIQVQLLKNNAENSVKENATKNRLLVLDYQKSVAQLQPLQQILALKKDTYDKNFNQFSENILPLERLLISQNDLIVSRLTIASSLATIGFNKTKIEINHLF